jgi:hypothetical protein
MGEPHLFADTDGHIASRSVITTKRGDAKGTQENEDDRWTERQYHLLEQQREIVIVTTALDDRAE